MGLVLGKINRSSFNNIYTQGKGAYSPFLGIKAYSPYDGNAIINCTVVVSSKVYKKAVDRNKIKRLIKSIILDLKNEIKPKTAIIVLIKPEIKKKSVIEIRETLYNLLNQIGFLNKNND